MMSKKKKLLITGSTGLIGTAIAYKAAENNFSIALHYNRNIKKGQKIMNDLRKKNIECFLVQADLSKISGVKKLFKKIDNEWGRLDSVVNNACLDFKRIPFVKINRKVINDMMNINFLACVDIMQESINRMIKQNLGSIVNISTNAIKTGGNNISHYLASKSALETISFAVSKEVISNNIRINVVRPGIIKKKTENDKHSKEKANISPIDRFGLPEEVADTVIFLLSDKSSYISGEIISVSGGY